jgi:hypothetical protein
MFEFQNVEKGRGIMNFVDTLCKETPEIAFELLSVPIKNVGSWLTVKDRNDDGQTYFDLDAVKLAKLPCGCLVGATFIAACKLYPEVVDSVAGLQYEDNYFEMIRNRVVAQLYNTLKVVDGNFGGMTDSAIAQVGCDVADQVCSWEEQEFEKFIKDRIRKNLSISGN